MMKKLASCLTTIWLAAVAATALAGPERFYYQAQWGTKTFQLLRAADGGLSLAIQAPGTYTFGEDGMPVEGWEGLRAEWAKLAGVQVFPVIYDLHGAVWVGRTPAHAGVNQWLPADFLAATASSPASVPQLIDRVGWQVQAGPAAAGELKSCQLLLPKNVEGGAVTLFADHVKPYPVFLPRPAGPDVRPRILTPATAARVFVAEGSLLLSQADWVQALIPWAKAKFPNEFGVDLGNPLWGGLRQAVSSYREALGAYSIYEGHRAVPVTAWLRNNQFSATRFDGFSPAQPIWPAADLGRSRMLSYHEDDTTQPGVIDMARLRLDAAYDAGFDSFMLIDYVWPYFNGSWGYGAAATAQWKKYLAGQGASIDLVDPVETWAFADYWKHFESIPLQPGEFGWPDWNAFTCTTEGQAKTNPVAARRLLLFYALWHFHYLVVADALGKDAVSRDREFGVTINPEDAHNGTDVNLLGRLKHLGAIGFEFFGDPVGLEAWRHVLPWLLYRNAGPKIDIVGEINSGGHGPSRYDRETAFAFYYDVTATALPRFYDNQYQESLWQKPQAPVGPPQLGRLEHWFAGAKAYLLRREEAARLPLPTRPEVTVVASRSVLDYEDSSTSTLNQRGNVAQYLQELNIDFEQVGRDVWTPARDLHTKVLFFCPSMASAAEWARVREWISTGTGKTLVLHGGDVWKDDAHPERRLPDPLAAPGSALVPLAGSQPGLMLHVKGVPLKANLWEAKVTQQTLLKSDDGVALLTGWQNGANRVLHIQPELNPGETTEAGLQIVAAAAAQCGLAPFAQHAADWSVDRSAVAGGEVAILWNTKQLAAQLPKKYFARVPLALPATIVLQVQPQASYLVYSVFEDRQTAQVSGPQGQLPIAVSSSADVIYYGLNSPALAATVQAAKQAYQQVKQETDEAIQGVK